MPEEWVDHSLDLVRKAENKLEAAEKAHVEMDKKLKETLAQLTEVEKAQRNTESTLKGYEKQATNALEAQRKVENKMALTMVELKQTKKQLKTNKAEISQAEQAAYDASMTKATESLTAQLKDVAQSFCLEVWGQALNAVGVSIESELRAPNKVYYTPALLLVPTSPQPSTNPSSTLASFSNQPAFTSSIAPTKDKEQEQPHLAYQDICDSMLGAYVNILYNWLIL